MPATNFEMKGANLAVVENMIPVERIASKIYHLRGEIVMIDSDLASLYGVQTRVLVQAVRRNRERFPEDFMFQLDAEEFENWRSQVVISNPGARMGLRHRPYAFTEQGVAMLASVLRSARAVEVNIAVVRTFVRLRRIFSANQELARRVDKHDQEIGVLFEQVRGLLEAPEPSRKQIGFGSPKN